MIDKAAVLRPPISRPALPMLCCGTLWGALALCGCGGSGSSNGRASAPAITSVSPATGPAAGGNTVTVTGAHFKFTTPVRAQFGAVQADATKINVLSDTQLTLVAPPGSGTVDVRIQTGIGTSPVVAADKYIYTGAGDYLFSAAFGSYGSGNGQFSYPTAIATDGSRNVYVADEDQPNYPAYARIEKFDSQGNYFSQFGSHGTGAGQFSAIKGIAAGKGNSLYVLDNNDPHSNRVEIFRPGP